jgi:hypothetical protein
MLVKIRNLKLYVKSIFNYSPIDQLIKQNNCYIAISFQHNVKQATEHLYVLSNF